MPDRMPEGMPDRMSNRLPEGMPDKVPGFLPDRTPGHWAWKVPGWGPAVPTGLGRSLVEVQRCPLRSEPCGWGPAVPTQIGSRQLRSSSAHCARKLAKRLAKSWQGGSRRGSGGRGGGGEGGGRGGGGGEGGGGAGTAVIKSNNPHPAGGEQTSAEHGCHVLLPRCPVRPLGPWIDN